MNPLDIKFKNTVYGISCMLLWMEIQEGKKCTKLKEYQYLGRVKIKNPTKQRTKIAQVLEQKKPNESDHVLPCSRPLTSTTSTMAQFSTYT